MTTYYLNPENGERVGVDTYGNLFAPIISGVTDDNVKNWLIRLKNNAGSGLIAFWQAGYWDTSLMDKLTESAPPEPWHKAFLWAGAEETGQEQWQFALNCFSAPQKGGE